MSGADEEYEERLTVIGALRWLRDEAFALFATFWLIAAFYALGFGLVLAFFQIDAEFSRPLAGGVVPPDVTQHLAWAVRIFSVIVGMAMMYCHVNGMPRFRNMLAVMGGIAALLLFLHAYGISAKIMEGQYGKAAAIVEIEDAATGTTGTQIATLQAQIDAIRADRDRQVDRLQASINGIVNDGLNNDELADDYRADQAAAENDARARIRPLEDQIAALTAGSGEAVREATEAKTQTDAFNPLFTFMARVASWTWNPAEQPSDTLQFGFGFAFFTLFFGFGEMLMMACFTIAYGMQIIVAKQRAKPVEAKEGEVIIKMTEQEAADMQAALAAYGKRREGDIKGGETRQRKNRQDAKRLEANQYMEKRKENVLRKRRTGASVADISKGLGVTPSVLGLEMRQWMSDAEYAFVFGNGPDPEGETDEDLAARA